MCTGIERRGTVSTTYGGFGFQGHLAFNGAPRRGGPRSLSEQLRYSKTRILPVEVEITP